MSESVRAVLILGGTGEAFNLAGRIDALPGWRPVTSMAGRTRSPRIPAGEVVFGGFGGVEGLAEFLKEREVSAVIDATHPFAEQITRNAAEGCSEAGIPLLRLERPPWSVKAGWRCFPDAGAVARFFRGREERVLITSGRKELGVFAGSGASFFLVRTVDPIQDGPPLENCELLAARGPFTVAGEKKILCDYGITWLVTKNSGGEAGLSKLIAAEEAGVGVCVINRPALPDCERVETALEAAQWLERL